MPYIYTISHPFTNEVVYVGCTKNIKNRIRCHLSSNIQNELGQWIKTLIDGYIIPKVEAVDIVEPDEMLFFERYWIQQFQSWGFNLFNISKGLRLRVGNYRTKKVKGGSTSKKYVKKTAEQWAAQRLARDEKKALIQANRKSKKWTDADFIVGTKHEVKNSRNSFLCTFKSLARERGLVKFLKFETIDGQMFATVLDEKVFKPKEFGVTKSGAKRYAPLLNKPKVIHRATSEKFTYGFNKIKQGDIVNIEFNKWTSFKICFEVYKKRHSLNLKLKYR